ncbi:hypothetical protein ACTFIU_011270 [Dictyostelium citrinum]
MGMIKSLKVFLVEDVSGEKTELVWVNGQMVDSLPKPYLSSICNPIRGDRKKLQINGQPINVIIANAKEILKEYVKNITNKGRIKLKNFTYQDCDCEICLNEPPIIIKEKKEYPKTASTWVDYVRISLFCINKQQKLRKDPKELKCRQKVVIIKEENAKCSGMHEDNNEEDDEDEEDRIHGGYIENGKDYYINTKDLYVFMRAHKGLLEIDQPFKAYQPKQIKQLINHSMHYTPSTFKSGKEYFNGGFWTLVDVDDDPWYDIDIPDNIPTQRLVNGVLVPMCLAKTQKGYCQKLVGSCPYHQKWSKSMVKSDTESDDDYDDSNNNNNNNNNKNNNINNNNNNNNNSNNNNNNSNDIKMKDQYEDEELEEGEQEEENEDEELEEEEYQRDQEEYDNQQKQKDNQNVNSYDDIDDGDSYDSDNNSYYDSNDDGSNDDSECNIYDGNNEEEQEEEIINENDFDMSVIGGQCKNLDPKVLERNIMESFSFTSILNILLLSSLGTIPQEIPEEYRLLPREYTRFMVLKFLDNDMKNDNLKNISLQAPPLITQFWHCHLSHIKSYNEFSRLLKSKIHCYPIIDTDTQRALRKRYKRTLRLYVEHFIQELDDLEEVGTLNKNSNKKTIYYYSKIPSKIWPLDLYSINSKIHN